MAPGATAEFLEPRRNRAPSYVLIAAAGTDHVEDSGNPPVGGGWVTSPRRDRGLRNPDDEKPGLVFDRAVRPCWSGRGPGSEAGCVAGLLHALDHPDPGASRVRCSGGAGPAPRARASAGSVAGPAGRPSRPARERGRPRTTDSGSHPRRSRHRGRSRRPSPPASDHRPRGPGGHGHRPRHGRRRAEMSGRCRGPRAHKAATGGSGRSSGAASGVRDH